MGIARNLEEQFINDARTGMWICVDCFRKRFKVNTKKRSGYGGTIYELGEKSAPRFGLGSSKLSCLKCEWVARLIGKVIVYNFLKLFYSLN